MGPQSQSRRKFFYTFNSLDVNRICFKNVCAFACFMIAEIKFSDEKVVTYVLKIKSLIALW